MSPFEKRQAEAPTLAPHKALKVSTGSTAQAEARASDEAKVLSVVEATEAKAKALRTSEAEAAEAKALRASEAEVAGVGAPRATEVKAAEASLGMVESAGQDAEMGASTEVEDLRLRCTDMKAEATMAWEQAIPLAVQIKELEEELTRVAGERDTFMSQAEEATASAKATAG
ncbi:uncharacterized protein [Miscanthus floridulus]|uniref:uncharacterized protein n=1 Tax=Miscanthus floridulus TaxID=154761 RepID=UPI003457B318